MTIEITGAWIDKATKEIHLAGTDQDEVRQQRLAQLEEDPHPVEYVFPTKGTENAETQAYFYKWLKRQRRVKTNHPSTWGEALALTVGTVTQSPLAKYRI